MAQFNAIANKLCTIVHNVHLAAGMPVALNYGGKTRSCPATGSLYNCRPIAGGMPRQLHLAVEGIIQRTSKGERLMLLENLAYRTAQRHIRDFAGEIDELMYRHYEAMECLDCETYLRCGIDAFLWLERADAQIRGGLAAGRIAADANIDEAFESQYRMWLRPCEAARSWVEIQCKRGFTLPNFALFKECESKAREIVENSERMKSLATRIPSVADLGLIAIKPQDAWQDIKPAS